MSEPDKDKSYQKFKDGKEFPPPYAGMPAEMVRHYASQTIYVRIRQGLFLFVVAIIALLVTLSAITISKSAPCLETWQKHIIYQVYPRSFKDSNGDGFGDLRGILEKADYFNELGITAIWLNPIYKSPQTDMGYDISDFREIDEIFGSMDDFEELIDELHARGIQVIMDIVPNHSSNEHDWFLASSDPTHEDHEKYKDYYVWKPARDPSSNICNSTYPNNWVSEFDGPAWEFSESRGMYYLHQFYPTQPDLNYANPAVVQEMVDIVKFWLDKGVDGFRIDAAGYIAEHPNFLDEPPSDPSLPYYCSSKESKNTDTVKVFTRSQAGMHEVLEAMKYELIQASKEPGVDKFMITEDYNFDAREIARYYGSTQAKEADFPFNFWLLNYSMEQYNSNSAWSASKVATDVIEAWLDAPKYTRVAQERI